MADDEFHKLLQPKLRQQAIELYDRMYAESTTREDGTFVWTGAFTNLTKELGIADGSYNKLRNKLVGLGCISFLQRGAAMQPSIILLNHSPSDVGWTDAADLTAISDPSILRQQIADMARRLGTIDVVQALYDIAEENKKTEERIRKVELRLRRLAFKLGVDPKEIESE